MSIRVQGPAGLVLLGMLGVVLAGAGEPARGAGDPTAEGALRLRPVQAEVAIDLPEREQLAKCTIKSEKMGKLEGWVVRDPAGQILRRFVDTNADNKVDQWCYYQDGIEVYRDIDSNFNAKADQYRWYGTAGMRWGIDKDEDGRIDVWRSISAEEVTAEVLGALRDRDASRFLRLLITPAEIAELGLNAEKRAELEKKSAEAVRQFADTARKQRAIGKNARWIQFGGTHPGIIPLGTDGLTRDLVIYENVVAIFESDGEKNGQMQVGTLVRVNEAWRMIDLPHELLDDSQQVAAASFFYPRADDATAAGGAAVAPAPDQVAMEKVVAQLEKLDNDLRNAADPEKQAAVYDRRADVLDNVIRQTEDPQQVDLWTRQLAEALVNAVQAQGNGGGSRQVERLAILAKQLKEDAQRQDLASYVSWRHLQADYAHSVANPDADFAKIQDTYLERLRGFVDAFPKSPDAAEAMMQLGITEEFGGREQEATAWYQQVVQAAGESPLRAKASGALRRLQSVGKPIPFEGKLANGKKLQLSDLKGRLVLIHYWATWCEPCKQDMAEIKEMVAKYDKKPLTVVGVNLDTDVEAVKTFLKQNPLNWPQVLDGQGLEGRLATELGILTLPTMILVGPDGNVLNRNIHITELSVQLKRRLNN